MTNEQTTIDFDRHTRDRLCKEFAGAVGVLNLVEPDDKGHRPTSPAQMAAVLRVLANMIRSGEAWRVKTTTIADQLGINRRTVSRALAGLRTLCVVDTVRTGRSSVYSIDWPIVRGLIQAAETHRQRRSIDAPAVEIDVPIRRPVVPTVGALCPNGSGTMSQQSGHYVPTTIDVHLSKNSNRPPPPGDQAVGGGRDGGTEGGTNPAWRLAQKAMIAAGLEQVGKAATIARELGYTPDQVIEIAEIVSTTNCDGVPAYGPGVIRARLENGTPDQPIAASFPNASDAYGRAIDKRRAREQVARQAARQRQEDDAARQRDAEREQRHGATLDALSSFERQRLARSINPHALRMFDRDPESIGVRSLLLSALEQTVAASGSDSIN